MPLSAPRAQRIARRVESWFAAHQRSLPWRKAYDPYEIWVSEVMAQQTRIGVVVPYFERFVGHFPTLESLASASEDEVVAIWSGLGYYRRARMMHTAARRIVGERGGRLPESAEELRAIEGIGRYTAGAIASIAFEQRAPVVDGNVARILARLFAIEEAVGSPALMNAAWRISGELVATCTSPRLLNQGVMELGALVCKPANPGCGACPLRKECSAYAEGRAAALPLPKPAAGKRRMTIPLYVVTDDAGRVLMRRESGPLMKSLFHLPHGDTSLLTGEPLDVRRAESMGRFRHTVTTRQIEFEVFTAELTGVVRDEDGYAWVERSELASVPHPSYVAKALRLVKGGESSPSPVVSKAPASRRTPKRRQAAAARSRRTR